MRFCSISGGARTWESGWAPDFSFPSGEEELHHLYFALTMRTADGLAAGPRGAAGMPQLKYSLPSLYFQERGLYTFLETMYPREQHQPENRRDTDPYVRWCESWGA